MSWFDDIADAVGDVADSIGDVVEDFLGDAVDGIGDLAESIADTAADALDAALAALGSGIELLGDAMRTFGDAVLDTIRTVVEGAADLIVAALDFATKALGAIAEYAANQITEAWDFLTDLLPDALDRFLDKTFSGLIGLIGDGASILWSASWLLLHSIRAVVGFGLGGICWLLGIDGPDVTLLRHIVDGKANANVQRISANRNIVVFSDLHMFIDGSPLNAFKLLGSERSMPQNQLYHSVLGHYASHGWTLVENGDVEDLWMRETEIDDLVLDTVSVIGWPLGEVLQAEMTEAQQRRLFLRILKDNALTYGIIHSGFRDPSSPGGGYFRTVGNHDDAVIKEWFTDKLRLLYPGIAVAEYVVVEDNEGTAAAIIAHGHQWDAWNDSTCSAFAGEFITPAVSAWPSKAVGTSRWEDAVASLGFDGGAPKGFDNKLTTMDYGLGSALMATTVDEIAVWGTYMDSFKPVGGPLLVLGHTHAARRNAESAIHRTRFPEYLNCGSAGRSEGLIWCVEIAKGKPRLVGWTFNKTWNPDGLYRFTLDARTSDGRLVPTSQPESFAFSV